MKRNNKKIIASAAMMAFFVALYAENYTISDYNNQNAFDFNSDASWAANSDSITIAPTTTADDSFDYAWNSDLGESVSNSLEFSKDTVLGTLNVQKAEDNTSEYTYTLDIDVDEATSLTLTNFNVDGDIATTLNVADGATFTTNGGDATLSNATTASLVIGENSTFNMNGGDITLVSSGVVSMIMDDGATFNMSGGSFVAATAKNVTNSSGSTALNDVTFNISGGYYNTSMGLSLDGDSTFNITGAGTAYSDTYTTYVKLGTFDLNAGTSLVLDGDNLFFQAYSLNVHSGSSVTVTGSGMLDLNGWTNTFKTNIYSLEGETTTYSVSGNYYVDACNVLVNTSSFAGATSTSGSTGTVNISFKGNSADSMTTAALRIVTLGNTAGTGTVNFDLNGHVSLSVSNELYLHSGTTFSLNGTNNSAAFNGASYLYAGSMLKIVGSANTVSFTSSIDFQSGATICFVADSSGFSAVDLASIASMAGTVELDLSNLDWTIGADVYYALFTSDDIDFETNLSFNDVNIVVSGEENVDVTTGYWTDANGNYVWGVTSVVVAVPEPSTYAMLFGLVALAFAYYRKRK